MVVFCKQQVRELQIAMQNAVRVKVRDARHDLPVKGAPPNSNSCSR